MSCVYFATGEFYEVPSFIDKFFPELKDEDEDVCMDFLCELSEASEARDEMEIKSAMGELYVHRLEHYNWKKRKFKMSTNKQIVSFLNSHPDLSVRMCTGMMNFFVGRICSESCPFFPHRKVEGELVTFK